jgi:hypothetical protein
MKINTVEPWFGERRIGFAPISWQGWIVTLIFIIIILIDVVYLYNSTLYFYKSTLFNIILLIAVTCYLLVVLLTSEYSLYDKEEEM